MPNFTTQAEMERLFSNYGLEAFSDHPELGSIDTDVITDCIEQATAEITYYCERFDTTSLSNSDLINRWATLFAVYFLCYRRGNPVPESIVAEFQRITKLLEQVQTGKNLPGVALRADTRPSMSNLEIDRRFRHSIVRKKKIISTDSPTVLRENNTIEPPCLYD